MNEDDVVVGVGNTTNCPYMSRRRDCDGDWDNYCCTSQPCPYKHDVGGIVMEIGFLCAEGKEDYCG